MEKSKRNSSVELLRIISMILIIFHHFSIHGMFDSLYLEDTKFLIENTNSYIIIFFSLFGKIAVNIFILISSYFMVNSKITLKKVMKIIFKTWTYSLLIAFILDLLNNFRDFNILFSMFPIINNAYWFVTTYILLMILSPYLNILINNMSQKDYVIILLLSISVFSIFPQTLGINLIYSDLGWFITLYLIMGYIRRYINIDKIKTKNLAILLLTLLALFAIIALFMTNFNSLLINYFSKMNGILVTLISVTSLLITLKFEFYNKFINKIASATFAVYLIHDNYMLRKIIWSDIFKVSELYILSPLELIFHTVGIVTIIFVTCTIIELFIQATIDRIINKLIIKQE